MGSSGILGNAIGSIASTAVNQASSYMQYRSQKKGARAAEAAQVGQYEKGITEQRDTLADIQEMMNPYINAGKSALTGYQNLTGLGDAGAQQAAINELQSSPNFQALLRQGENSILQNAAATGGLRGGNTQGALAQYSPAMLNNLINQRVSQYGTLASMGQGASQYMGNANQNITNQITALQQGIGSAQAGSVLAQAKARAGWYAAQAANADRGWAQFQGGAGGMLGGGSSSSSNPVSFSQMYGNYPQSTESQYSIAGSTNIGSAPSNQFGATSGANYNWGQNMGGNYDYGFGQGSGGFGGSYGGFGGGSF